jgi:hypothetical protein
LIAQSNAQSTSVRGSFRTDTNDAGIGPTHFSNRTTRSFPEIKAISHRAAPSVRNATSSIRQYDLTHKNTTSASSTNEIPAHPANTRGRPTPRCHQPLNTIATTTANPTALTATTARHPKYFVG